MNDTIPTEVYVAFLDRTFDVHWDYHALLMMGIWFVLVPIGIFATRFFKPKPITYGIEKGTGKLDRRLIWWDRPLLLFVCGYRSITCRYDGSNGR